MGVEIRRAIGRDAVGVAALNSAVQQLHFEQRPDWFKPPNPAAFVPTLQEWLSVESTAVFVAELDGGVLIGYVAAMRRDRPDHPLVHQAAVVELDQLVVTATHRRTGVGTSLCLAVLDWAQQQRVDRIELSTWHFNNAAYTLFERLGFAPTQRRMSLAVVDE